MLAESVISDGMVMCEIAHGGQAPPGFARNALKRLSEGDERYGMRYMERDNYDDAGEELYDFINYLALELLKLRRKMKEDAWQEQRALSVGLIGHIAHAYAELAQLKRVREENVL